MQQTANGSGGTKKNENGKNNQAKGREQQPQDLNQLLKIRREKLAALQEEGRDPFRITTCEVTHHSVQIREQFEQLEGKMVAVAGRLMSKRIMGKASFIELQDSKGRIQVYVSRDDIQLAEDAEKPAPEANDPNGNLSAETLRQMYNVVFKKLLDIGDFIGIEGFVFRTQMGEISVHAKKLTVLAKSLRPLAIVKYKDGVAYDGFNDPELRYRQRYVDLIVNDGVKDTFLKRATIIRTDSRWRECPSVHHPS